MNIWNKVWKHSDGFNDAIDFTLRWEGGYVNHPNDPGGATKYGITERYARGKGYTGSMRELPLDLAKYWYREDFWEKFKLDELGDKKVAGYLFDMAVNHGGWVKIAQKAVSEYVPVDVDGKWGKNTHAAFKNTAGGPFSKAFLNSLRVERCRYVTDLAEKKSSMRVFLLGWLRRYLA